MHFIYQNLFRIYLWSIEFALNKQFYQEEKSRYNVDDIILLLKRFD